jgi:acetyltransferase-like isoleucine patch superfamily enzyme
MRENYIQAGTTGINRRRYLDGDWYSHGIPSNICMADNVYIDTSYGFAAFHSKQEEGMFIDEASGCYDRSSFVVSEHGKIQVGKFCILNGTSLICNENISIGNHCMLAWGSVITDTWLTSEASLIDRQIALKKASQNILRPFPVMNNSKPVVLEDNCWVGFGAVIMPGVTLGRGCIVGCKTIVTEDVPPYAIVAGSDAKIVKYLSPDDMEQERRNIPKSIH